MVYDVNHARFQRRRLAVKVSLLTGTSVMLDGGKLKGRSGHTALDDDGREAFLKADASPFSRIPVLVIDQDRVELAPPLPIWAYVVSAIPLVLMVAGGLLGGLFGGMAWAVNMSFARTAMHPALVVLLCLSTTAAAAVAYTVGVVALQLAVN